jgi:hypothetical protein
MKQHEWIEDYILDFPKPPRSPATSRALLSDPHLRHVYEAAGAVQDQEEGLAMLACGLATAVSGVGRDFIDRLTDGMAAAHAAPMRAEFLTGHALGLQMVWSAGYRDFGGSPLTGALPGLDEPEQSVEEWLSKWAQSLEKA